MTNRLPLLRVVALNAIAGSIDLLLAVEGAYFVPAIYNLGLSPLYGAMLLSLSPFVSIIFQGYLGSATDRCMCRWGRRRPFILGFVIAGLFGLSLFPFVEDIADVADTASKALLISLVIMTTFITDFFGVGSVQVPFRAYALDVLPQKQVVMGNIAYSICLSLGSAIGFGIGAVNWASLFTSSDNFSLQVKIVFGLTFVIIIVCVTITLFSVPEQNPAIYNSKQPDTLSVTNPVSQDSRQENCSTASNPCGISESVGGLESETAMNESHKTTIELNSISVGTNCSTLVNNDDDSENNSTSVNRCFGSFISSLIGNIHFLQYMSLSMVLLCVSNFFVLLSLLSQVFFFTSYVAEVTYEGDITAPRNSTEYKNYVEGVQFGSLVLGVSAVVGLVVSLLLGPLIKLVGMRPLLVLAITMLMLQSGVLIVSHNRVVVFALSPAVSVINAVMLTFPFILVAKYEAKELLLRKPWPYADKVLYGRACAILKCSTYVAQVIALIVNGPLRDAYGSAVSIMILTSVSAFLGAVVTCFVTVPPMSFGSKKEQKRKIEALKRTSVSVDKNNV